jgi:hypothetical protein
MSSRVAVVLLDWFAGRWQLTSYLLPWAMSEIDARLWDVWQLGSHRVLRADASDPDSRKQVLGEGERLACVWTDPPYGVSYVEKTGNANDQKTGRVPPPDRSAGHRWRRLGRRPSHQVRTDLDHLHHHLHRGRPVLGGRAAAVPGVRRPATGKDLCSPDAARSGQDTHAF